MIIGAAAVAVLAVAGVAYAAAFNTYSAKLTFSPSKAGSKSKASPLAFTEHLGAKGTGGNRAAPLVDNNLVTDVPLPPDVSTKAGGLTGVYGSLIKEALTFKKLSTKVKGKTVGFNESFACKKGKRPYVVQYTSVRNGVKETPQRVA